MDKFVFFCILVFVICNEGVKSKVEQNKKDDNKIVGGEETTIENYPYQAFLLLFNGADYLQCGGSIISKYWVVTAAHCLTGIEQVSVRIGSTDKFFGGIQYDMTYFYSHPMFNTKYDYDVGVVSVPQGMDLDATGATTISLAGFFTDPEEGEIVTVTGWGDTEEEGNTSGTLRVVELPIVSRENCSELLNRKITSRMICAGGSEEGGKDTCQGDSGGPAALSDTEELVGITSNGFGCARPNTPGIYTRVGNFEIRLYILSMTGV